MNAMKRQKLIALALSLVGSVGIHSAAARPSAEEGLAPSQDFLNGAPTPLPQPYRPILRPSDAPEPWEPAAPRLPAVPHAPPLQPLPTAPQVPQPLVKGGVAGN